MKPIVKNILTHSGIVIIFFLFSILFFHQMFTSNKVLDQGDTSNWQGMVKEQKDFLKETGTYTNWNSSMFSGMPTYQITNKPQESIFRAKDALIFYHIGWAENVGVIFLYLIGFYICLVALGVNPWLSLIGAFAFGLGSYNIIIIGAGHISKAWALAMVAPIFSGIILTIKKKYVWGGILFTFALGFQIAFNHLQITYYTLLSVIILGIVYLIYAIKDKTLKDFGKAICILIIGTVFAVGGNARLLMMNMEYSKYTMRGGSEITVKPDYKDEEKEKDGLSIDYAFEWSYGIGETYTLLVPGSFGGGSHEQANKNGEYANYVNELIDNHPELSQKDKKEYKKYFIELAQLYWGDQQFTSGPVYFGAIIVFLFILGLFIVKGPERWWLLGITIMAIILSWGKNLMGINEFLFDHLPMYNKFRTPSMSLVIANVAMVMMAILALKNIFDMDADKRKQKIALYISTGITCGIILIVLTLKSSFSFEGANDEQIAAQLGENGKDLLIQERIDRFTSDSWRSIIFILLSAATLFFAISLRNKKKTMSFVATTAVIAALVITDLWMVDHRYLNNNNYRDKTKAEIAAEKKAKKDSNYKLTKDDILIEPTKEDILIDQYAEHLGDKDFRVMNMTTSTFNDSRTSAFHHSIGGYHGAKLRRYQDLIDFYMTQYNPNVDIANTRQDNNNMAKLNVSMPVLNMLNTRFIVLPFQHGPEVTYNPNALGSAWFVDGCQIVDDANAEILALKDFSPADTAIIDKRFTNYIDGKNLSRDPSATIEMEHQKPYNPDYLVYNTNSNKEQLAVFSEVYYEPDWKAYIDGQPAEYFRANYILRAMVIPAGKHKIEFINEAPMMKVWDTISIIFSILLAIAVAGALFLKYRKGKSDKVVAIDKAQ